ncbi:MAG: nitroreductase family protein [Prevotellaceae bacterium]|nr:nitroreductase family protein [Prevotellaceae bacterium]
MNLFQKIKRRLPLSLQFLCEMFSFWKRLCRYNASVHTDSDMQKMQYTLLRENHVIEKGLSMRNPRRGFGQQKVLALIERLHRYYQKYGTVDCAFLIYPLSTIKAYIAYQQSEGVDIHSVEYAFQTLCENVKIDSQALVMSAGTEILRMSDIQKQAMGNFENLLYSRHSIRYFRDELPSRELLEKALNLSARTPSACNRQAWHTHIFFGEDAHELLRMQSGCNGFCDDIPCCVVVTADMKGFLEHEPFQCFIDGGLYAQNLINALHYVGLGGIPLSCGFFSDQLMAMQKRFHIPKNEVLIVMIGTGVMYDEMKVAISTRRSVEMTNTYH